MVDLARFSPDLPASEVRLNVALDLTSTCNLRCTHCWMNVVRRQGWRFRNDPMPLEVFEKILAELEGQIDHLSLSCAFEPFILRGREIESYLEVLSRHPVGSTNIYTNGVLLGPEAVEALIDAGLTRLTISIDGAQPETFERIRLGAKWDRFLKVLEMIQDIKRRRGMNQPVLRFNWTLMRSTIAELPDLVRLAARFGVAEIFCLHLVQYRGLDLKGEALYWDTRRETFEAIEHALTLGRELDVEFVHLPPVDRRPRNLAKRLFTLPVRFPKDQPLCSQPWTQMRIAPNGAIQPCDGWFGECIMGNWAEQSWEEIWNGWAYRQLRRSLWRLEKPHKYCRQCAGWWPNRGRDLRARRMDLDTARMVEGGWLCGVEQDRAQKVR